ncbi:MAG: BatD family protein, partial [Bacteroidota bacterium]
PHPLHPFSLRRRGRGLRWIEETDKFNRIMIKWILICLIIQGCILTYGQHPVYQYQLSTDNRKIILGESVTLTLKIIDPMIYKQIDHEKFKILGEDYNLPQAPPAYACSLTITPNDTGALKIGPYEIEYQGKKLVSNEITLVVVKKNKNDYLVFDLPPKALYLGNAEIKIRSRGVDISNVELKESEFIHVKSRGNISSTNTHNGNKTVTYTRTFKVDFLSRGVLRLSKDDLFNLPDQVDFEPDSILVE